MSMSNSDLGVISKAIMTRPRTRQLIEQMAVLFEALDFVRVLENDITASPNVRDRAARVRVQIQEKGRDLCREIRREPLFNVWAEAHLERLFE